MDLTLLRTSLTPSTSVGSPSGSFQAQLNATAVTLYDAISTFVTNYYKMREERLAAASSNQTAFTITYSAPAVSGTHVPIRVYRNGTRLAYVASGPAAGQFTYSGTTVTTSASTAGDLIVVEYLA